MTELAIDFGTTRTKVAYFDQQAKRPQVIELGREVRSVLPSLFYIPKRGEILVGDDAVDEARRDRRGVVRGLKMEIDKRTPVRKNKRKVDRIELAAVLFCTIKEQCQTLYFHDTVISECILTIPPSFSTSPNKINAIKEAAQLGGFDEIETIEEPIAAARHWLTYGNATCDFVFVCDIGGGTTDLALLKRVPERDDFQLFSELPPVSIEAGGNNIDNGIFEQLDPQGVDVQGRDEILLRIKQDKEYVSRFPDKDRKIQYLEHSDEDIRQVILRECADFIAIIKVDIENFIKKASDVKDIDLKGIPLLLVGGGMYIHGLKESFSEIWPGTVILWTESEHATVLGALANGGIGDDQTEAEYYFKRASALWCKTLRSQSKLDNISKFYGLIDDVITLCDKSLNAVDRYPMAFNLKNILVRETNLLEAIDKAKTAWSGKDFETAAELCATAIKFYPKNDLPLPATDYYDDDLITHVLLMQAEAYDALEEYSEVVRKTKECIDRKPDLKSAYLLRITNVLKGINAVKFKDTPKNWQKLVAAIDYALTLKNDNWGVEQQDVSKISLLKYKAYAFFKQEQYAECQETLFELLQDIDVDEPYTYCLYNLILSYVYMKGKERKKCSDTLEEFYLDNDFILKYFVNFDTMFFKWIKGELSLTPLWAKALSFSGFNQFHDTCLDWWVQCNQLESYENVSRLYQINSKQRGIPWNFRQGKRLIQHDVRFLLRMAHVLADQGDQDNLTNCLKALWNFFPATPLSQVIEDEILKTIIIKKFPPEVTVYYDYGILENWIRIYNHSPYPLHNITIKIWIRYKDDGPRTPRKRISKRLPTIAPIKLIPPIGKEFEKSNAAKYTDWLNDVFPDAGWFGRNIAGIEIAVDCRESELLAYPTKKHIQHGMPYKFQENTHKD